MSSARFAPPRRTSSCSNWPSAWPEIISASISLLVAFFSAASAHMGFVFAVSMLMSFSSLEGCALYLATMASTPSTTRRASATSALAWRSSICAVALSSFTAARSEGVTTKRSSAACFWTFLACGSSKPTSTQCSSTPRPSRGKPKQSSLYSLKRWSNIASERLFKYPDCPKGFGMGAQRLPPRFSIMATCDFQTARESSMTGWYNESSHFEITVIMRRHSSSEMKPSFQARYAPKPMHVPTACPWSMPEGSS
mmetsp:Transcript_95022/g.290666  ORF Transcript_95022/g.290666 Transcript_95022/m.290666 type:complete len:253 (-) Transcript_95022:534-1292(-)